MAKKRAIRKKEECFVIMPISDPAEYERGHFKRVYSDIIQPACESAGYDPVRADDVSQTNLIHLDIVERLVEAPMAICDLSSRNPNVLFELGIRQAFDKPVVLIQEEETKKIFDIAVFRIHEYRKRLRYHEVLEDQKTIEAALMETKSASDNGKGVNSLIKLLSIDQAAKLPEGNDVDAQSMIPMVLQQLASIEARLSSNENRRAQSESKSRLVSSLLADLRQLEEDIRIAINHQNASAAYQLLETYSGLISVLRANSPENEEIKRHVSRKIRFKRQLDKTAFSQGDKNARK